MLKPNASDKIRTCDPRLRRPMLYPTELRTLDFLEDSLFDDNISRQKSNKPQKTIF